MIEVHDGFRHFDKCRLRWTQRASEVDFTAFVVGKHIVNHLRHGAAITDKHSLVKVLKKLGSAMASNVVQSAYYQAPVQFYPATYCLEVKPQLCDFFRNSKDGLWVMKNADSNSEQGLEYISETLKSSKDKLSPSFLRKCALKF